MMSPARTWSTQPGRLAEKTARFCSSSVANSNGPGSIRSVLISSPNFQTLPEIASGDLGRAGDTSGDRRGGDGRGRGHIDARAGVAHAAFQIAGAGSDAGLTGPERPYGRRNTRRRWPA